MELQEGMKVKLLPREEIDGENYPGTTEGMEDFFGEVVTINSLLSKDIGDKEHYFYIEEDGFRFLYAERWIKSEGNTIPRRLLRM